MATAVAAHVSSWNGVKVSLPFREPVFGHIPPRTGERGKRKVH